MILVIDVAASQADAFVLISDITRHGEWSPQEFEAKRIDDGPTGVGTRYRTAGRKGARKGVLRSTDVVVTVFDPMEVFGFDATEKAGTYRTTFQISADPDGGARIVRTVDPPASGLVPFIRHRILRSVVRSYLHEPSAHPCVSDWTRPPPSLVACQLALDSRRGAPPFLA